MNEEALVARAAFAFLVDQHIEAKMPDPVGDFLRVMAQRRLTAKVVAETEAPPAVEAKQKRYRSQETIAKMKATRAANKKASGFKTEE